MAVKISVLLVAGLIATVASVGVYSGASSGSFSGGGFSGGSISTGGFNGGYSGFNQPSVNFIQPIKLPQLPGFNLPSPPPLPWIGNLPFPQLPNFPQIPNLQPIKPLNGQDVASQGPIPNSNVISSFISSHTSNGPNGQYGGSTTILNDNGRVTVQKTGNAPPEVQVTQYRNPPLAEFQEPEINFQQFRPLLVQEVAPQRPLVQEVAPQRPLVEEVAPQRPLFQEVAPQRPLVQEVAPQRPILNSNFNSVYVSSQNSNSRGQNRHYENEQVTVQRVGNAPPQVEVKQYRNPSNNFQQVRPLVQEVAPQRPLVQEVAPQRPLVQEIAPQRPRIQDVAPQRPLVQEVAPQRPLVQEVAPQRPLVQEVAPQRPVISQVVESQGSIPNFISTLTSNILNGQFDRVGGSTRIVDDNGQVSVQRTGNAPEVQVIQYRNPSANFNSAFVSSLTSEFDRFGGSTRIVDNNGQVTVEKTGNAPEVQVKEYRIPSFAVFQEPESNFQQIRPLVQEVAPQRPRVQEVAPQRPRVREDAPLRPLVQEVAPQRPLIQEVAPQRPLIQEVAPQRPRVQEVAPQRPIHNSNFNSVLVSSQTSNGRGQNRQYENEQVTVQKTGNAPPEVQVRQYRSPSFDEYEEPEFLEYQEPDVDILLNYEEPETNFQQVRPLVQEVAPQRPIPNSNFNSVFVSSQSNGQGQNGQYKNEQVTVQKIGNAAPELKFTQYRNPSFAEFQQPETRQFQGRPNIPSFNIPSYESFNNIDLESIRNVKPGKNEQFSGQSFKINSYSSNNNGKKIGGGTYSSITNNNGEVQEENESFTLDPDW